MIVPSTGLNEFNAAVDAVIVAAMASNAALPPAPPTPIPTDVLGEQLTAPAPATARAPAGESVAQAGPATPEVAGATLPRTGQETRRGPVLAAGVVLMFGGFGLLGGNRRPKRPARRPA